MGALLWFLKAFLKLMKPVLSVAFIESLLDALDMLVGIEDEETQTQAEEL